MWTQLLEILACWRHSKGWCQPTEVRKLLKMHGKLMNIWRYNPSRSEVDNIKEQLGFQDYTVEFEIVYMFTNWRNLKVSYTNTIFGNILVSLPNEFIDDIVEAMVNSAPHLNLLHTEQKFIPANKLAGVEWSFKTE